MERIATLKHKEVVNVRDGFRLGFVCDVVIDVKCGRVLSLIVPGPGSLWGIFCREKEYIVDWCSIVCIGEDIILIDVNINEILRPCEV